MMISIQAPHKNRKDVEFVIKNIFLFSSLNWKLKKKKIEMTLTRNCLHSTPQPARSIATENIFLKLYLHMPIYMYEISDILYIHHQGSKCFIFLCRILNINWHLIDDPWQHNKLIKYNKLTFASFSFPYHTIKNISGIYKIIIVIKIINFPGLE